MENMIWLLILEIMNIHLILPTRAGAAKPPKFQLLDISGKKMYGPLSKILIDEIKSHLKAKNQVLLFLNRRGLQEHTIIFLAYAKASFLKTGVAQRVSPNEKEFIFKITSLAVN